MISGFVVSAMLGAGVVYASVAGLNRLVTAAFIGAALLGGVALQVPLGRWSDRVDRRLVMVAAGTAGATASFLVAAIGLADRAGWEQQVVKIVEMSRSGVATESDAYLLLGLAIRMLRARQEHLPADALSEVVARWAAGRGHVPIDPTLVELIGEGSR